MIPVYGAGELDDTLYLIMRWVDGTDLGGRLRSDGALAPAEAIATLRPVASALAAAHRRGLVHRDVKPANVLIARREGEDEHVYLTDFGIARRTDGEGAMTRTGVLVGTLDYTAPERIHGGTGTPASDIYAFGCMLFETLTGHIPFDRPTELAKMHAHLNDASRESARPVPEATGQLDEIVAKTMAKDPAERFESAAEVATALDRALDEAEDRFGRLPPPGRAGRTSHRRDGDPRGLAAGAHGACDYAPRVARRVAGSRRTGRPLGAPARVLAGGVGLLIVAGIVAAVVAGGGGGGARRRAHRERAHRERARRRAPQARTRRQPPLRAARRERRPRLSAGRYALRDRHSSARRPQTCPLSRTGRSGSRCRGARNWWRVGAARTASSRTSARPPWPRRGVASSSSASSSFSAVAPLWHSSPAQRRTSTRCLYRRSIITI